MQCLTSLGQAIADPTRVRIIAALRVGELCVCELVDALEISQSTLSTHLQVLRQTGMVIPRKEGRWVYYSQRLAIRENGRCVLGFTELEKPQAALN